MNLTFRSGKLAALALAMLAGLAHGGAANAQSGALSVVGGVDFSLNPYNDFFGGQTARIGGRLSLDGPAQVTYRLVAAEAAWNNTFSAAGTTLFQRADLDAGRTVSRTVEAGAGLLDFGFVLPSPQPEFRFVSNAANEAGRMPGFGVMMLGERTARILLDDYGWLDADYDDMVVEVSVTPIPEPAEWLIMAAGLAFAARGARRRRAA